MTMSTFSYIWSYVFSSDSSVYLAAFFFGLFINIFISLRVHTLLLLWSLGVFSYSLITSLWPQVSGGLSSPCGSQECPQGVPYQDLNELWNEQHWDPAPQVAVGQAVDRWIRLLCSPLCGMEPSTGLPLPWNIWVCLGTRASKKMPHILDHLEHDFFSIACSFGCCWSLTNLQTSYRVILASL